MPRNSRDNSLDKLTQVNKLARVYLLKPRYNDLEYENQSIRIKRNIRIISKVDKACEALGEPHLTIFKNTFFSTKEMYWWKGIFSKTTFYRLRNEAIKDFLLAYENYEK